MSPEASAEPARTQPCPVCRKEIPESGMKNHLNYHKMKDEKVHVCQVCNKIFTTLHSLKVLLC